MQIVAAIDIQKKRGRMERQSTSDRTGSIDKIANSSASLGSLSSALKTLKDNSVSMVLERIPFNSSYWICAAKIGFEAFGVIDVSSAALVKSHAVIATAGEAIETLSQYIRDSDCTDSPKAEANIAEAPEGSWLASEIEDHSTGWVEGTALGTGRAVSLPAHCILRGLRNAAPGRPPLSVGCAAGLTVSSARLSALLELIERDAVAKWWRSGQPARLLHHRAVGRAGGKPRIEVALDIGRDTFVPVVAVLSTGLKREGFVFASAARPTLEGASTAAARELAQMELGDAVLRSRARTGPEDQDWAARASIRFDESLIGYAAATVPGSLDLEPKTGEGQLEELATRLCEAKVQVYLTDLTRAEYRTPVVKAMSPQLLPSENIGMTKQLRDHVDRWGTPPNARLEISLF
ncbi:MAG: YcaO-like family protein [Pseudomonadota bacterium]